MLITSDILTLSKLLIASLLLSFLSFLAFSKRDIRIARESKLLYDIKKEINNAEIIQENYLEEIEAYYYELSSRYSILEMSDILSKTDEYTALEDLNITLPPAVISILKSYIHKTNKNLSFYLKLIKECKKRDEKLSARLLRAATNDSLDLYLLAILYKLKF